MRQPAGFTGLNKIVSGGQTGVDRGALDAAITANIPHGGWCPLGRRAEDGEISSHYQVIECDSPEYPVRTELNVVDSDGTLILHKGQVHGGTRLTQRLAERHNKPLLLVNVQQPNRSDVEDWIRLHEIHRLNVAGPRESTSPGIAKAAYAFLLEILHDGLVDPKG